jgi:hypothetical protein
MTQCIEEYKNEGKKKYFCTLSDSRCSFSSSLRKEEQKSTKRITSSWQTLTSSFFLSLAVCIKNKSILFLDMPVKSSISALVPSQVDESACEPHLSQTGVS